MARVTNALLVRWAQGWLEVTDAASITAHGRHEDFLSAGDANTPQEAQRVAEALLARIAWPSETITIAIEAGLGSADTPYTDFVTGDVITAPDHTGTPTTWRVKGFTVSEDAAGNPIYVPEIETEV